jgi:hypothetical protein
MAWKPSRVSFFCAALLLLAGCREQEQISQYLAPKESMPEPPATRMLAVMVPPDKARPDVWFFKFEGPTKIVGEHLADFNAVVDSARFTNDDKAPLKVMPPADWRLATGVGGMRYATLRFGPKRDRVEITITKLGPEAADVRQNLDRWRGQLSLPPLTDDEYRKLLDNTVVDGVRATRVDLVGVRGEGAPMMAAAPQRPRPPVEPPALKYTTPDSWEARPPIVKQGIRIPIVFRITAAGGREAEATAMSLPGEGGGIKFNIDRWRGQVGLPPTADEAALRQGLRRLKVDGGEAFYVDLAGAAPNAKRILGAIVPHGGQTWFFTLKGPADLVGQQQSNFEAFVTSVRFGGEPGAAHE